MYQYLIKIGEIHWTHFRHEMNFFCKLKNSIFARLAKYTIGLKSVLCISDFTSIFKLCSQEYFKNVLWKQISIQPIVVCWKGTSMYYVITKGEKGGQKIVIFDYVKYGVLITFSTEITHKGGGGVRKPQNMIT